MVEHSIFLNIHGAPTMLALPQVLIALAWGASWCSLRRCRSDHHSKPRPRPGSPTERRRTSPKGGYEFEGPRRRAPRRLVWFTGRLAEHVAALFNATRFNATRSCRCLIRVQ